MIDLTFYFHVVCCDVIWKINRITLFLLMYQSCSFGGTFKVDLSLWWEGSLICYLENLCMMVLAISVEYPISEMYRFILTLTYRQCLHHISGLNV